MLEVENLAVELVSVGVNKNELACEIPSEDGLRWLEKAMLTNLEFHNEQRKQE